MQTISSAVEDGVGSHDAHHLPRVVTVLVLHVLMEEVQVSWNRQCVKVSNEKSSFSIFKENIVLKASCYHSDKQQRPPRHPFQENHPRWLVGNRCPWFLLFRRSCEWQITREEHWWNTKLDLLAKTKSRTSCISCISTYLQYSSSAKSRVLPVSLM